jgi:hypothetical protein
MSARRDCAARFASAIDRHTPSGCLPTALRPWTREAARRGGTHREMRPHRAGKELLRLAATIAWTHHERLDGGGYPRGLAGEESLLEGRIAAVADVFDALTRDRVYRPRAQALDMLEVERGHTSTPRSSTRSPAP